MLISDATEIRTHADKLVTGCHDIYVDEIAKYPNTRYGRGPIGGICHSGTSSISANGNMVAVLGDTRWAAMPNTAAEGCSPSPHMINGPGLSVLKSFLNCRQMKSLEAFLLSESCRPCLRKKLK